jgi:two-component system sensor histidine kinase/response regulator
LASPKKSLQMEEQPDKNINKFLKENDAIFKHLLSFDILVLLDANCIQQYVSNSCKKILGYNPEELTETPIIEEFIHPEDRGKVKKNLSSIIEGISPGGIQYRHRHKKGNWVYLEAYGSNQLNNPYIRSVVINIRDITVRKNAEKVLKEREQRLKELNATKDRFFSIIGHDLKSPFNSIMGFTDLLLEQIRAKDYEGIENYARIIQKSSKRAMALLTNLLEWSRSQTGRIDFNPEYVELVKKINLATEFFNDTAGQKSITIVKKLPHNIPVWADRHMISSILHNLISNGIKFSPPGSQITITAEPRKDHAIISVADNGVGIKENDLGNLFSIEHCQSTPGTQNETGTGLGLLICKEFVEMHKCKIWSESQKGKGSTFFFTLPLA